MAHPRRVAKVSSQIQREISEMFIYDKVVQEAICPERRAGLDDKLSAVASVTHVYVSNDLQVVKAYVSVYSDELGKERAISNLKRIAPYVRNRIGQALKLRLTPEVRFEHDDSLDELERIQEAIGQEDFDRYLAEAEAEARGAAASSSSSSAAGDGSAFNQGSDDEDEDEDGGFFDIPETDTKEAAPAAAAAAGVDRDDAAGPSSEQQDGEEEQPQQRVSWSKHDPATFFAVDDDEDEEEQQEAAAWYGRAGPFDDLFGGSGEELMQEQQQQRRGGSGKRRKQQARQ
ncbi:hypothetical protein OEZ85_001784 [Tetradesmus obliquus]|uniref:Ribosome-binding factor A n=1 Tax=Tetradesmus obliquus TaxID=3088 RepID=A0ABY8U0W0_TETOB|nr:hypothetical protein OEZ85_001784 [Tetradesmus obliquus]